MKKLTIMLMLTSISAFATEGAADQLASGIIGIVQLLVCLLLGVIAIGAIVSLIGGICLGIGWLWEHSTLIGKILLFGIPTISIIMGCIYCIVWHVIPWMNENFTRDSYYIMGIVILTLLYIVTLEIGWRWGEYETRKTKGICGLIARIIALLPVSPFILTYWLVKNGFGKVCITHYKCTSLVKIWQYNN